MRRLVPIVAALLMACGAQQQDDLHRLADFSLDDLAAAQADAEAHHDVIAVACYPAIARLVGEVREAGAEQPKPGGFYGFQRVRDGVKAIRGGGGDLPDYLKLGCAALAFDAAGDAKLIINRIAAIAAGGIP